VFNRGGTLTITNSTIRGNAVSDLYRYSGGVANDRGTCTVINSTITGNSSNLYGGVFNRSGTLTITNSTISGNHATNRGGGVANGGVANYGGTLTVTNSTISGNTALFGGGVFNVGKLTVTDSIITGNSASEGGGVASYDTLTVTNSTISGNSASYHTFYAYDGGGGVKNTGTLTVTNSTISGNYARYGGGGVVNRGSLTVTNSTITGNSSILFGSGGVANFGGTLTVTNSTISGNSAGYGGGGIVNRGFNYDGNILHATLILARALISGNTAPTGPEVVNGEYGIITADQFNLFGVDGQAGVEGFSLGHTDVVPPAGVLLSEILDPTLALHGGRTVTHALVPGSPAIDAAGPECLNTQGEPLTTDQRGRPRPVDGNGDGVVACDIGAFEFVPLVSDLVTLDPEVDTGFDPTVVPGGPAGTFTVTGTSTNTSPTALRAPFFEVTTLSGGNLLLNADGEPGGVGTTLTPDVGDGVLAPGETVTANFVIGLQERAPFTFVVELFGEPVP
jgi:hypothetical protein